ncbi:MAG: hypothetical protein AB7P23_12250 [Amphiplicatus sp.]
MRKSLDQLDFERRRVEALLAQGDLDDAAHDRLVEALGDIDLAIAASPAGNVDDLRIKIERLVALIHPMKGPIVEDCLEHVLLAAILRDARALTASESAA